MLRREQKQWRHSKRGQQVFVQEDLQTLCRDLLVPGRPDGGCKTEVETTRLKFEVPKVRSKMISKSLGLFALSLILLLLAAWSAQAQSEPDEDYADPLADELLAPSESARTSRRQAPTATTTSTSGAGETSLGQAESDEDGAPFGAQQAFDYHSSMPVITKRELANAVKQASSSVDRLLAELGASDGLDEPANESASWLARSMFHRPAPSDQASWRQMRQAMVGEEATRLLAKQYKLTRQQVLRGLPLISVDATPLGKQCPQSGRQFNCLPASYRSLSGHCNNVQNPHWASARTPLVRYSAARYADQVAKPARSSAKPSQGSNSNLLPSARQVSAAIYGAAGGQHSHMTTMLSFFGQLVFHDVAFVAQFSNKLSCCAQPASSRHPECLPIEFQPLGQPSFCLDYVRSAPAVRPGCNLGPRDQLNLVSSYLDGSAIYGSSEAQARALRTHTGGRLRSQRMASSSENTGRRFML